MNMDASAGLPAENTMLLTGPRSLSEIAIKHFHSLLLAERGELVAAIGECEHMLDDGAVPEMAEATSRDEFEALLRGHQESLDAVDLALSLIDAGIYGRCSRCGSAIPFERLEAIPSATTCVVCQRTSSIGPSMRGMRPPRHGPRAREGVKVDA